MWYINLEMKKIIKSKLALILFILTVSFAIIDCFIIKNFTPDINIFKFIFKGLASYSYFPIFIAPIAITCFLFAREFQYRTIMYTFIKSINYNKLFFSKILVAFIYSILLIVIYSLIIFTYGFFNFKLIPFEFDVNIMQSITRCIIYILYLFIGVLLTISITALISIKIKNLMGSFISTISFLVISNVANLKVNIFNNVYRIPLSTYLNPASYYENKFDVFINKCGAFTFLNLLVITVLILISYSSLLKIKKGIKMI